MLIKTYMIKITNDLPTGSVRQYTHGLSPHDIRRTVNIAVGDCARERTVLVEISDGEIPDIEIRFIMFATAEFEALRDKDSGHCSKGSAIYGNTVILSPSHLFEQFIIDPNLRNEIAVIDPIGNTDDHFHNYVSAVLAREIMRFPIVDNADDIEDE